MNLTAQTLQDALDCGGALDLSDRACLMLTGPDARRYLNGQVTNNVANLPPGEARYACFCTHKGKVEGDCQVAADGEALRIDLDPALRESAFARLGKYIIADDCELADATGEAVLVHYFKAEPPAEVAAAAFLAAQANRIGVPGTDLWFEAGNVPGIDFTDPAAAEIIRLRHGIAKWGAELTPERLPQEAAIEDRAVDFHKGCYIGQEVISRIKSVGRVNRRIQRIESESELRPGEPWPPESEGDPAGEITSAAFDPLANRWIGLALVRGRS